MKLLLVKTGNMSTEDLCSLFERHLSEVTAALEQYTLVEIDRASVTPRL
jgi:predicted nuclease of predicted toxin-antitoxin system